MLYYGTERVDAESSYVLAPTNSVRFVYLLPQHAWTVRCLLLDLSVRPCPVQIIEAMNREGSGDIRNYIGNSRELDKCAREGVRRWSREPVKVSRPVLWLDATARTDNGQKTLPWRSRECSRLQLLAKLRYIVLHYKTLFRGRIFNAAS